MPQAQLNGWPSEIDFEQVHKRLLSRVPQLGELITNLDRRVFNPFWQDAMLDLAAQGRVGMTSLQSQLSTFDKAYVG